MSVSCALHNAHCEHTAKLPSASLLSILKIFIRTPSHPATPAIQLCQPASLRASERAGNTMNAVHIAFTQRQFRRENILMQNNSVAYITHPLCSVPFRSFARWCAWFGGARVDSFYSIFFLRIIFCIFPGFRFIHIYSFRAAFRCSRHFSATRIERMNATVDEVSNIFTLASDWNVKLATQLHQLHTFSDGARARHLCVYGLCVSDATGSIVFV